LYYGEGELVLGNKLNISIITPIMEINGVMDRLVELGEVKYLPDPNTDDLKKIENSNILFTNPNKTKVYLGFNELKNFYNLAVIVTASTGTVHIDTDYCKEKNIQVINLSKEYETLRKISSTAELALTGTLAACRRYIECVNDARDNNIWDYENYVGRQILGRKVGVIGYGRLGFMYAKYMLALGAEVFVYEKNNNILIDSGCVVLNSVEEIFMKCEIISLHIHAETENIKLINKNVLSYAVPNLILVNTSRGEIVNEFDIVEFLKINKSASYVTDVISNESFARRESPLYSNEVPDDQLIISQHIGGMTSDAQRMAYNRAVDLLEDYLKKDST